MADILIIIGTEGGNARFAAEAVRDELAGMGHSADLSMGGDCIALDLPRRSLALLCTSTYGFGDLPENLQPFAHSLRTRKPDLRHLRYGVIALGDQTYSETFCKAGRTLDEQLRDLGARRVGDRLEIDACTQPLADEEAAAWAREWAGML